MNERKLKETKQRIFELMKPFIDENNSINLTEFRLTHKKQYGLLPHYFGSVDGALVELGLVKVMIVKQKGASRDLSFKDKLALDMLNLLRTTESFESIAQRYGVTKPLVSQLHKTLKAATEKIKEAVEEKVNG